MSLPFSQEHRLIALEKSPVGRDTLLLTGFRGKEEISGLFSFELEMLSGKHDIGPQDMVGKRVTFRVTRGDGEPRYFNGYVNSFAAGAFRSQEQRTYYAKVVPWLWFLTRTTDCRIFQSKTIPQIVEQIFKEAGFNDFDMKGIKGEHSPWDYRVQYRESDFNFVSRLMEQEGIFYWFRHTEDKHTLMLGDRKTAYDDLAEANVEYVGGEDEALSAGHIYLWQHGYHFISGRWSHRDYNFKTPSANMESTVNTGLTVNEANKYERYDYPGCYLKRDEGDSVCKLRMEAEEAGHDIVEGASGCRSFQPGGKFTLKRHDSPAEEKKKYVIVSVAHEAHSQTYGKVDDAGEKYKNAFVCVPSELEYRPQINTWIPRVQGPQTAVVVGPAGEEIHTDEFGRVKIQFHWDREGKKDDKSSCWVRVSHPWAGKGWGAISLPRIGQEVIVDFLEGDPDQPIITGRVYNAEQTVPYALPENKTQSGIQTRSSKGGSGANCNEIRFEDKKGGEQLYIHAEKNQDISVENDETHTVGHDRSKTIDHDETTNVKNNRTETVGNNETITVVSNRTENVGANESITVAQNRTRNVGANEVISVALTRTHNVGINEMINVGAAQEVTVGGLQAITVGATRAVTVGISQNVNIGTSLSENVGTSHSETIGTSRTTSIGSDHSLAVGGGQTASVAKDDALTVSGGRSASVSKDDSLNVTGGRSSSIGKDDALKVGKNLVIDAGDSVTIKTGSASITMKKDGTIQIKGKDISINASGKFNAKASGDIVMKGSKIAQN